MSDSTSRREIIKSLAWAAGTCAAVRWSASPAAAPPPHLDVKDPAAVAQGYVENAAQVDRKKYPTFVPGSSCENCLQLQGTAGNNYRPCGLFPGKLVSVSGWCKGWTEEM